MHSYLLLFLALLRLCYPSEYACTTCGLQCHSCTKYDYTLTPQDYVPEVNDSSSCGNETFETCTWGHHCGWIQYTVHTSLSDIGLAFSHEVVTMSCVNDTLDSCTDDLVAENVTVEATVWLLQYSNCYQWFCFQDYCNQPSSGTTERGARLALTIVLTLRALTS